MTTKAAIPFLVGMMLLTGVCNTLLTKYQDNQCVRNCSSSDPKARGNFEQPVWQTGQMFIGEAGCWLVVLGSTIYNRMISSGSRRAGYEPINTESSTADDTNEGPTAPEGISGTSAAARPLGPQAADRIPLRGWRVILLALPASFDIIGTSLMNVGLLFVAASIYQMTRGALVLFVALFSVIFLRSRLAGYKWLALVIVVAGVALVGLAGIVENRRDRTLPGVTNPPPVNGSVSVLNASFKMVRDALGSTVSEESEKKNLAAKTAIGILLIFLAQIFTASQFVVEESIMHRYSVTPLTMVGWEGVFGLLITAALMVILHFAYGRTPAGRGGYFDASTGWHEMTTNAAVGYSSLLIMVSIGGFNFFGLSVTRSVSATSRSTIDTCRTLFIWVVSLGLGWESFKWLQVVGFALLVYGTFVFNDIVRAPGFLRRLGWKGNGQDRLLPDRPPLLAET